MNTIDELPAGRELDCKVALALGWCDLREEEVQRFGGLQTGWFGCPDPKTLLHGKPGSEAVPYFSSDIENAWELVRLIEKGKGGCPLFSLKLDRFEGKKWECLMGELAGDGTWWVEAEADTPELAICRAFLKSKEPKK